MVYFILGRITFKLMDFEPIEISPYDEGGSQLARIIKMIEVLVRLQHQINNSNQPLSAKQLTYYSVNDHQEAYASDDNDPYIADYSNREDIWIGKHPMVGQSEYDVGDPAIDPDADLNGF